MSVARKISLLLAAALFLVSGIGHFRMTETFMRIVPPYFPDARLMVEISGVAELAGAVGLLVPVLRRAAGWGLAALLVAVFPANLYMATDHIQIGSKPLPDSLLWGRLALQPVLIAWVLWCSKAMTKRANG